MTRSSIEKHISEIYGTEPEYPWAKCPNYAVFRHTGNKKWFAVIMDISKKKLGINDDSPADIMNIKCDPSMIGSLLMQEGFFPAYHMNKSCWVSVLLDGSTDENQVKWLIDMSFELTNNKRRTV